MTNDMNEYPEIINCPFCGTIAKIVEIEVPLSKSKKIFDTFYKIACIHPHCGANTKKWYPKEAAINAWNCRVEL